MKIAILDPDVSTVNILSELIDEMGQTPSPFTDKDMFLEAINPDIHSIAIISDDFTDVIEGTKQVYNNIEIIGIGKSDGDRSMQVGASHYLRKPFKAEEIRQVLGVLLDTSRNCKAEDDSQFIISDQSMKGIMKMVNKVAPTQAPVFIQGESGTGKEVIARYIHNNSKRRLGPYIGINLAAIPDTLLESELFGYEKGAFTGAYATRTGKFELADKGTILLDEITEINPGLQAKLLRVLQEKQIDRVGGKSPIKVDFRVIATTNRDIEKDIGEGRFRKDLFFRLNVIPIRVPPLCSRRDDILPLAGHFIRKVAKREGMGEKSLSREAKDALCTYSWPGNVRELENVMERAMILSDGDIIHLDEIMLDMASCNSSSMEVPGGTTIEEMEKRLIVSTLKGVSGNRTKAAALLGISIRTLRNKLNDYTKKGQFSDANLVKTSDKHAL